jgi:hypothetical protein
MKLKIQHRDTLVRQQVENIQKLLDGEVKHQVVVDSYGNVENRIIITYKEDE